LFYSSLCVCLNGSEGGRAAAAQGVL